MRSKRPPRVSRLRSKSPRRIDPNTSVSRLRSYGSATSGSQPDVRRMWSVDSGGSDVLTAAAAAGIGVGHPPPKMDVDIERRGSRDDESHADAGIFLDASDLKAAPTYQKEQSTDSFQWDEFSKAIGDIHRGPVENTTLGARVGGFAGATADRPTLATDEKSTERQAAGPAPPVLRPPSIESPQLDIGGLPFGPAEVTERATTATVPSDESSMAVAAPFSGVESGVVRGRQWAGSIEEGKTTSDAKLMSKWMQDQYQSAPNPDTSVLPAPKEPPKAPSEVQNPKAKRAAAAGSAKCTVCGKSFSSTGNLSRHMRTHSDVRPFPCPHCPKRFRQNAHLKKHVRTHTGEKPFECEYCGRKFTQKVTLIGHVRAKHTKEKPFGCQICDKRFPTRNHLRAHVKRHEALGETGPNAPPQ